MLKQKMAEISQDDLSVFVDTYRANGRNVSATSRELGISRQSVKRRIDEAGSRGILGDDEIHDALSLSADEYISAKARKQREYQEKKKKGRWDKPVYVELPQKPFCIIMFGDPHLDDPSCDFEQFEDAWLRMDVTKGIYGACIGDWFNNWLRVLGHLWKEGGNPDDAWVLFEHLMEERGGALIAACSGNHDDWTHAPYDPIDLLMKRHGVRYRKGAIRLLLNAGGASPISIALRHKWRGHSMYSPAHGIRKAAAEGMEDDIMVGGHIHQDELRMYAQPRSGKISHICQISSFKKFDLFADVHGFKSHVISPVWFLVVDPERHSTDPDKVKVFWDGDAAECYLAAIRK